MRKWSFGTYHKTKRKASYQFCIMFMVCLTCENFSPDTNRCTTPVTTPDGPTSKDTGGGGAAIRGHGGGDSVRTRHGEQGKGERVGGGGGGW